MQKHSCSTRKIIFYSFVTSIVVLCMDKMVFANLTINTNMENAVQTIKRIIVTDNGNMNGSILLEINPEGASEGNGEMLKVKGKVIMGEIDGPNTNIASGNLATVAGGQNNHALGNFSYVGGGIINEAKTEGGVVGGGRMNIVNGKYGTIPGGYGNNADGITSFAAGSRAKAIHNGTFVRSDTIQNDFTSTKNNQFLIRSFNGVGINTNNPLGALQVVGSVTLGAQNHTGDFTYYSYNSILGGVANGITTSDVSVVVGGQNNIISASDHAIIAGGENKRIIDANNSFAAGKAAEALHSGSFVWSDGNSGAVFSTTQHGQFLISTKNGVAVNTNISDMGILTLYGAGNAGGLTLTQGGSGATARVYLKNDDNLYITRGGQDAKGVVVSASGAVAIGHTSPTSGLTLDIAGKVGADEYCDSNGQNCITTNNFQNPQNCAMTVIADSDLSSPTTKEAIVSTPENTKLGGGLRVYYNGCPTTSAKHSFCMINLQYTKGGENGCHITMTGDQRTLISTLKNSGDMCGVRCVNF